VKRDAFSLVEVTLALGVAALSLLAIFALLPLGVKTNQVAIEQSATIDLLSAVAADLRATPATTPRGRAISSSRFAISIPGNPVGSSTTATLFFTTEGQFSSEVDSKSRYRVTIKFLPNGAGARTATFVDLKATWPATASLTYAGGVAEMFIALDRN
jgi:uncharacterized protein (TIGR02598 family)